jgi:hypothetical protein
MAGAGAASVEPLSESSGMLREFFAGYPRLQQLSVQYAPQRESLPDPRSLADLLLTPVQLAPRFRGGHKLSYEIYPEGHCFDIVEMRNSHLTGIPAESVRFEVPVRIHTLKFRGQTVTTDSPQESYTQYLAYRHCHGHVLVGGLGVGMAPTRLLRKKRVKSVVVVEKSNAVIRMVGSQLPDLTVVKADLFRYLKNRCYEQQFGRKFDSAFFDIWSPTEGSVWDAYVVPLRRLVYRNSGPVEVGNWGELEMRGLLREQLFVRSFLHENLSRWRPYWVFLQGLKKLFSLPIPLPRKESIFQKVSESVEMYLNSVGSPEWESLFPWDSWRESES